ncbi:hypothetical protein CAPTEDRAFT_95226 [Capitella teleta]|uniref:EGF-like domain-containing protein n=1 Tax=Capitella teleta TaxID=283909 RepID=R7TBV8_CAPTE|nr:hypothetical protein CAPTEDRAFT_95226 [Capitella teleta]|eukprot:ELT88972.1 hypothetical protein CAPTEDRAFT_95226 [Capitella teleta]
MLFFQGACQSAPCLNAGECTDRTDGYECSCKSGYSGDLCEDECASAPCSNGATCQDGIESYKCMCASSYKGETCSEGTQKRISRRK